MGPSLSRPGHRRNDPRGRVFAKIAGPNQNGRLRSHQAARRDPRASFRRRTHPKGLGIGMISPIPWSRSVSTVRIRQMARYEIGLTDDAKEDLWFYSVFERKLILSEIRMQLSHEPSTETKNRKRLRTNPLSTWELRIGKYRIFYDVHEGPRAVAVVSIGHKEHNILLIRGMEVQI